MFLFVLIISLLPSLYPLKKIWKLRDITLFDILQIFTSLYYVFIPIKVLYLDLPDLQSKYISDFLTPVYYFIFNGLVFLINFSWTSKFKQYNSPFNITRYIKYWDKRIVVKENYVFLFIIFFTFLLITLTNYSNLTDENYEQNVTAGYGIGVSFWERMRLIFTYNTYPVFLLLNLKLLTQNKSINHKFKKLSIFSFILGCLCVILASKTMMMLTVVFIIVYLYSINRFSINRKFIIKTALIFSLVVFVVFPLSQGLRMVKQSRALSGGKMNFIEVFEAFINIDKNEKDRLIEGYQRYQGRSLNVYQTLHWATTNSFRGDGELTVMVYKYLIPQRITNVEEGNILGDIYLDKGADIGESVLAWFIADWGFLGILITIMHFIIIISIWILYKNLFYKLFHDPKIELLFIFFLLTKCVNVEENPTAYIHGFYSQWLICFLMYTILFKLFDRFNKKTRRSVFQTN